MSPMESQPALNPFCHPGFPVAWSKLTPEASEPAIRAGLSEAAAAIERIAAQEPASADFASSFLALEAATEGLSRGWGLVGHLKSVCDRPAIREAYNRLLPDVTAFFVRIPLNARLWQVLKTVRDRTDATALEPVHRRLLEETVADFISEGADLPADKQARLAAIAGDLAEATRQFGEHVLDATNAWDLVIEEPERLAGLPASAVATARASARDKGLGSEDSPAWRFTLHAPSVLPVLTYADDRDLRRTVWQAFSDQCSQGDTDNTDLVWRILKLRQEKAELLGKAEFAGLTLERRMAKDGATARSFIRRLQKRTQSAFRREWDALNAFVAERTGEAHTVLEPWDTGYWAEKRQEALFAFNTEALRPYFPMNQVIEGVFTLAQRIFDLEIRERPTAFRAEDGTAPADCPEDAVEVWHPLVRYYDVYDRQDDRHLGGFYADWYPRESKRSGAWMNPLLSGRPRDDGSLGPQLGLIAGNMTPGVDGQPALLTHREVETVFHEFGHLLHHLCGRVPVPSLNGTRVAWDFVELPSQIMENWCWERESLDFFARHHETGEPIPDALFGKMLKARNYMSAAAMMRQLSLGMMDLALHLDYPAGPPEGDDLDSLLQRLLKPYTFPYRRPVRPIVRRFTHLFSNPVGYACGYYSYKWAEVLEADAFTRFKEEGILNPETGRAFRETILARGNSAEPAVLFHEFLGREPDETALLRRSGLLSET
ncbi:MAG: M3 family metallopeptidase [Opitutales bacterium]